MARMMDLQVENGVTYQIPEYLWSPDMVSKDCSRQESEDDLTDLFADGTAELADDISEGVDYDFLPEDEDDVMEFGDSDEVLEALENLPTFDFVNEEIPVYVDESARWTTPKGTLMSYILGTRKV